MSAKQRRSSPTAVAVQPLRQASQPSSYAGATGSGSGSSGSGSASAAPSIVMPEGITIVLATAGATQEQLDRIVASAKFTQWYRSVMVHQGEPLYYRIHRMTITDADWFGPTNLGFVKVNSYAVRTDDTGMDKFKIDPKNPQGARIPDTLSAITFVRGGSVAILVRVTERETLQRYFIFTRQLRFPVGDYCTEACAGMLDASGDFIGVAANELKEELGLPIRKQDLEGQSLGWFYPSPGGCDERIQLFYIDEVLDYKTIQEITSLVHGEEGEGEAITLVKVPERNILQALSEMGDAKGEIAYHRFMAAGVCWAAPSAAHPTASTAAKPAKSSTAAAASAAAAAPSSDNDGRQHHRRSSRR